jgi:trimethylamine--corrinoid protein Co-methyltransferase
MLPAMAGANMVYGAGMLELGMSFSMEQLVIDNDIIGAIKKVVNGIPVTNETIALDAIMKVGAANNFLSHKSTRNNIDVISNPMLFDRAMYGDWEHAGSKDIKDVAHEKVRQVMSKHEVIPIDKDLLKDMQAVMAKADKAERK